MKWRGRVAELSDTAAARGPCGRVVGDEKRTVAMPIKTFGEDREILNTRISKNLGIGGCTGNRFHFHLPLRKPIT